MLAALLRQGWRIKRQSGAHRILERKGWPDVVFAFHDDEELGTAHAGPDRQAHRPEAAGFVMQEPNIGRGFAAAHTHRWTARGERGRASLSVMLAWRWLTQPRLAIVRSCAI